VALREPGAARRQAHSRLPLIPLGREPSSPDRTGGIGYFIAEQLAAVGAAAQAIVAQLADILADEPTYDDFIAVDGKANY
jgi:hypothetical protein